MVEKAIIQDIKEIHSLLGYYADQGLLLPRPLIELYNHLRDYFVLQVDQGGKAPPLKVIVTRDAARPFQFDRRLRAAPASPVQ